MLEEQIHKDLEDALRKKDQDKLRTLRFLLSNLKNLEIEKYPPQKGGFPKGGFPDEDVISVVQRLIKTHGESIEAFKAGGRQDLVDREEKELTFLRKYLPTQISEEEIKKVVGEVKAGGVTDFGQIMREVMTRVKGKADGAVVARVVRESL